MSEIFLISTVVFKLKNCLNSLAVTSKQVNKWYTLAYLALCIRRTLCQSKTVKRQSKQQKWPLVYQWSHVYTEFAEYTKSAFPSTSASTEYTKPIISRKKIRNARTAPILKLFDNGDTTLLAVAYICTEYCSSWNFLAEESHKLRL